MSQQHEYREAWFHAAVDLLKPLFAAQDIEVPTVRISVGFPGGRSKKSTTVGQCWSQNASADNVSQIFIHPVLTDAVEILGVMIHELIHAVDDCQSGHKGDFVKMFRAMGMVGKPTASGVGDDLKESLEPIIETLGEYPHACLGSLGPGGGVDTPKKQTTRMLKQVCSEGSDFKVRTTRKMLDEYGAPKCPCHDEPMVAPEGEE